MRVGKRLIAVVIVAACVLTAGVALAGRDDPPPAPRHTPTTQERIADYAYPLCVGECQQERATDVFVGRVVERAPGTPVVEAAFSAPLASDRFPTTLYTVEVLRPIRGQATGRVVVFQSGVLDEVSFTMFGNGAPLLESGEIAVFVTVWDGRAEARWYALIDGWLGHDRLAEGGAGATAEAEFVADFGTPAPSLSNGADSGLR